MHEYHLDQKLGFNGEIPIWVSLTVIIATLAVTTVASLVKSRFSDDQARADAEGR